MKNCLVFLTKTFPFGAGEEFIANELPTVARRFEKVFLLATSVPENAEQTRTVPENTRVFAIPASGIARSVKRTVLRNHFACPAEYRAARRSDGAGRSPVRRLFFSYLLSKGTAVFQAAQALLPMQELDRCDSVTFYSYWFYDTALAAVKLEHACRAARRTAYSRAHRYDLYPENNPTGYLPLRPFLLDRLDRVFPCSENGSRYLRETYPEFAGKISTSYLGTADRGTGPAGNGDEFQLVSCCHISPVKRVDLLEQALAKLSGTGLKLRWTHFGGGGDLEKLKQFADEHLGFLRCEFAGEVTNKQLMEFYRTHPVDLFVNTSNSEGLPVSIMEACSFGIPAMATDVGGTSEIVRGGRNGFLLSAGVTPDALATEIARFCRTAPGARAEMRSASRKIWEENFNAETNYGLFAEQISSGPDRTAAS